MQLVLEIVGLDPRDVDRSTRSLLTFLQKSDVPARVEPRGEPVPRAGLSLGALDSVFVTITKAAFREVLECLHAFLQRRSVRGLKVRVTWKTDLEKGAFSIDSETPLSDDALVEMMRLVQDQRRG